MLCYSKYALWHRAGSGTERGGTHNLRAATSHLPNPARFTHITFSHNVLCEADVRLGPTFGSRVNPTKSDHRNSQQVALASSRRFQARIRQIKPNQTIELGAPISLIGNFVAR